MPTTTRKINGIPDKRITTAQANQIIQNQSDIATLEADKQDNIVATTDLTMNDLSVGNDAILPANLVQYPLKIQQPFLTGANPQNNFGVGIMFRYPRGGGTTTIEDQASIDSYYRSAGNTTTPYGGLKFSAIDGGGRRPLFDAYQTDPVNNGASTMEIGLNSQGTLKTRYITLNGTDLATTLLGKQPTITSTTGLVAQSITLSGDSIARQHLNAVSGSIVRGYGMFHFTQTGTNYNMNLPQGKAIRWTNKHSDTSLYTIIGLDNQNIRVSQAGFYEVSFTIFCTSSVDRPNPSIGLFKNGTTYTGIGAWSYIRNFANHNEATWVASAGIVQMNANNYFTVVGAYTQTGNTGAVYLVNQTFTGIGQIRPYLLIKRIA